MKIKTILTLSTLFFVATTKLIGQGDGSDEIRKFVITDAEVNGVNRTEQLLKEEAFLVLYRKSNESDTIYFANVWKKSDSQSFGRIFNSTYSEEKETDSTYATEQMRFRWSYKNNYDDEGGTATVKISIVHKPVGQAFKISIIPEDLDVLIYKGYVANTLVNLGEDKFKRVYDIVAIYEHNTGSWSDWSKGDNKFIFNYDEDNNIAHVKPNGSTEILELTSDVEEKTTEEGEIYQIVEAENEKGEKLLIQFFNKNDLGLKLIYDDRMLQFAKGE